MTGIECIFLENYHQYKIFKEWLEKQPPLTDKYGKSVELTEMLIPLTEEDFMVEAQPVMKYVSPYVDAYLIRNCPFSVVQENLMGEYGHWTDEMCVDAYNYVCERDRTIPEEDAEDDFPFLSKDDFVFENGIPKLKIRQDSVYEKIRDGKLYTSPIKTDYTKGTSFKCTAKPSEELETDKPECGEWFIDLSLPDEFGDHTMWYSEYEDGREGTWDFTEEFVSGVKRFPLYARLESLEKLKSLIPKWELPVGTYVVATSTVMGQKYEFLVE